MLTEFFLHSCRAQEYKTTRSQKKVLKKFNKFLSGEATNRYRMSDSTRRVSTCSSAEAELTEGGRGEQFVETSRGHQTINLDSIVRENIEESSSNVEEKPNGNYFKKLCEYFI